TAMVIFMREFMGSPMTAGEDAAHLGQIVSRWSVESCRVIESVLRGIIRRSSEAQSFATCLFGT
ncbi:hypothetical protein, partial [Bacillus cereus group sp. BC25]|uniref:hypothetical protein n=1 Tax=Bacillus cereus group sp. BC25 TaxID=3445330 RepID=UPI003F6A07C1